MEWTLGISAGALLLAGISANYSRISARNSGRSADAAQASKKVAEESSHRARTPKVDLECPGLISPYIGLKVTSDRDLDSMEVTLIGSHVNGKSRAYRRLGAIVGNAVNIDSGAMIEQDDSGAVTFNCVTMGRPVEAAVNHYESERVKMLQFRIRAECRIGADVWSVTADSGEVEAYYGY